MDPKANLDEQCSLSREIEALLDGPAPDANGRSTDEIVYEIMQKTRRLTELVISLAAWIDTFGYPPNDLSLEGWANLYLRSIDTPEDAATEGEAYEAWVTSESQALAQQLQNTVAQYGAHSMSPPPEAD